MPLEMRKYSAARDQDYVMELPLSKRWRETLVDGNLLIFVGLPVAILLQNAACFGFLCGITVLSSYLVGIYCCRCVTRKSLPSFAKNFLPVAENDLATSCNQERVHRPMFTSRSIDRALDQLFCRIIEQYISAWYTNISSDTWFQFEIRSVIRRIACDVYGRINRISLERFVLDKALPICLAHANAANDHQNLEITRLHVAVHSRKSEVLYVQNLSKCILKFLLPTCDLNCKSYAILLREIISKSVILSLSDAVCNPCVLNRLILRHLELNEKMFPNDGNNSDGDGDGDSYNYSDDNCDQGDKEIRLLRTFADVCKTNSDSVCLRPDVNSILKDKELQNTFMRFLRSQNAEHVLQFCLDIASFNEKILKPELEAEELDDLYRDAWDLFSVYFSSYSPNCVQFHKDLASPLRKALSKDILKLRTTATLFEAYEYAFSILENHCQHFHNSAEFYRWLYGRCDSHDHDVTCPQNLPPAPPSPSPSSSSSSPSSVLHCAATTKESFGRKTMAEIGQKFSKIKEALKTESVLDGRFYGGDFSSRAIEAQEFLFTELDVDVQLASAAAVGKNINAWKISIPSIDWRTDPATDTAHTVLVIRIVNENDGEWLVERRPADVHSLNAKLVALGHEMGKNLQLPILESPKAKTVTPTMDNVQVYEEYMKKLIELVELNDSELLYDFFTSAASRNSGDTNDNDDDDDDGGGGGGGVDGLDEEDDEVDDDDYENEESSIGKIFRKSVVPTLRKERGQNLESFVNSLISSCATTKYEWKDVGGVVADKKSLNKKSNINLKSSHLYGNNFDVDASRTRETVLSGKAANATNQFRLSPFSLIIHIAYKIYNLRMEFVRILLCFKSIFGTLADRYIFKITSERLKSITNERNVAYFINTIEWAVFDNKTKYSQHEIRDKVTKLLIGMNDNWLHSMYRLIFQTLQDAKKNKQLFYNLCDALMEELFPEIFTRTPDR